MSRQQQAMERTAKLTLHELSVPAGQQEEAVAAPDVSLARSREELLKVEPLPIVHPFIAGWKGRNEVPGEDYRKLRSMVVKLTRKEHFRNTLLITSSVSGEGKTLTAINLALALAQEYDHTVLLVDADLRKPSIHKYLGFKAEVGLIHCLKSGVPLAQALVKTGLGKLIVLPAGGVIDDPVEMLASARMKEIILELKHRYPDRYIIFDAPPVLPVADAQVLAQVVDGVIFVVRERAPKLAHVAEALKGLQGARILGAVYNDTEDLGRERYYYQYR